MRWCLTWSRSERFVLANGAALNALHSLTFTRAGQSGPGIVQATLEEW